MTDSVSVDVHAHAIIPSYHELLHDLGVSISAYGDGASDLTTGDGRTRIDTMDEAGVRRQWLSTIFAPYLGTESDGLRAARWINDAHADLVRAHSDRLDAYAALPLPHIDAALIELERCLDQLGMIGVALQCACLDESLAAKRFDPIYAELDRRKAVLFFHPCVNGLCSPLVSGWGLAPTAGTVFEDTTIALHLISRQILHRYPNMRVIIPHLGGVLPMLLNRLDNQQPKSMPDLPELPSHTARRLFYDTVGHGSKPALRCAVDAFGADRLLPGSDYPVLLAFESYTDTFDYIRHADLPEAIVHDILVNNATRLHEDA
jgi:predicted TIM-barrel fold metal-dependent hydrolase